MYLHHSGWGYGWGPETFMLLPFVGGIIILALLWNFLWKGLALWHSARRGEWIWFIVLLLVNTLGILEIIYLFAFAKLHFRTLFSKHSNHNHQ